MSAPTAGVLQGCIIPPTYFICTSNTCLPLFWHLNYFNKQMTHLHTFPDIFIILMFYAWRNRTPCMIWTGTPRTILNSIYIRHICILTLPFQKRYFKPAVFLHSSDFRWFSCSLMPYSENVKYKGSYFESDMTRNMNFSLVCRTLRSASRLL